MSYYPEQISKQTIQKILEQMNNSIYKVKVNDKEGILLFCNIKYKKETIPTMITNYELIDENYLRKKNNIELSLNNKLKSLEFGNIRYLNQENDISIIQIKNIKDNKINYLELVDGLYEEESEILFNDEPIYITKYQNENNISFSFGKIKYINNQEIKYISNLNSTPYHSPIFNLCNNKLIGLFISSSKYHNKGIFLKHFIYKFTYEYEKSKYIKIRKNEINEIKILININEADMNKKIYFLNLNLNKINKDMAILNKLNTNIYINDEEYGYKKFFIPDHIGEYIIKLKFNIELTNCSFMFANCENIIDINFITFDTKKVTNMKYMFHKCKNLKTINLFSFDTINVTDMSDMFSFCENLTYLDLSSFNTQNVTNTSYMFCYCYKLKNLGLFTFDSKNFIKQNFMYEMCINLDCISFDENNNGINKYESEINLKIYVDQKSINTVVYFLDNSYNSNEHLKELNKLNTQLYINNKKYGYKNIFYQKNVENILLN